MKTFSVSYNPFKTYKVVPGTNPFRDNVGRRDIDLDKVFSYLRDNNTKKRAFVVQVNPSMPKEDKQSLEARLKQIFPKFSGIVVLGRKSTQN